MWGSHRGEPHSHSLLVHSVHPHPATYLPETLTCGELSSSLRHPILAILCPPGREEHQSGTGTYPRMTGPGNRIETGIHVFYILLSPGLCFSNFPRFIKKTKRVLERILLFPGSNFQDRGNTNILLSALCVPVLCWVFSTCSLFLNFLP